MKVEIKEKGIIDEEKQIYRTETYLKNMFVGNVRMMDHIMNLRILMFNMVLVMWK